MQSENKIFEDFAKMANGFAGTMAGMAREGESAFKEKLKGFMGGVDFVSREEFEAVKAMAAAARDEIVELRAELAKVKGKGKKAEPDAPTADNPPPQQD